MVTERSLKTWANVCQVSKIRNQIKPEKQSENVLSSWHVRGISTNRWRSVMWNFWGYRRGVWCVHFRFVYFPFTLLLASKSLAVLKLPCNDVALRWLPYCLKQCLEYLEKQGTRNVQTKRYLLLMLQCSLFSLWGEEWDLHVWSFE